MTLLQVVEFLTASPPAIARRHVALGLVSVNGKTVGDSSSKVKEGDLVEVGNGSAPFHIRGIIRGGRVERINP